MKFTIFNRQSEVQKSAELAGPITPQKSAEILDEIERKYGRESSGLGYIAKAMARFSDSRLTHAQGRRSEYEFTNMEALRQMNKGLCKNEDRKISSLEDFGPYQVTPETYKKIRQEIMQTEVKEKLERCRSERAREDDFSDLMAIFAALNGAYGYLNFINNENRGMIGPIQGLQNYLWFINKEEKYPNDYNEYKNWIKMDPKYHMFSFEELGTSEEELRTMIKRYAKRYADSIYYEQCDFDGLLNFLSRNGITFKDVEISEDEVNKKIKDRKELEAKRRIERAKTVKEVQELLKIALAKLEKIDGDLARTNLKLMI